MRSNRFPLSLLLVPLAGCASASAPVDPTPPASPGTLQAAVDAALQPGIASGRWPSAVVGVYDRGTTSVFGYGRVGGARPDARTIYEIGSITKTFTAALLAGLDRENRVRLDDPVRLQLPASVRVPSARGDITLLHLATHTSGLPRLPDDLDRAPFDAADPYAGYGLDRLFGFLSRVAPDRAPGARYEYSNFGFAVLGQALAFGLDLPWEEAVLSRVVRPLGLADTRVTLDADLRARLAPGTDARGRPARNWDLNAHAPAGALKSTTADLLAYVAALLGHGPEPLAGDLAACRAVRFRPADQPFELGLAWHLMPLGSTGRRYVFHNGGTGGYSSVIVYLPDRDVGVTILANSANEVVAPAVAVLEHLDRQ